MRSSSPSLPPASQLLAAYRPDWLTPWTAFAADLTFEDLPRAVVDNAKRVLLDSIGAIAAGMGEPEMTRLAQGMAREDGAAAVIGLGRRTTVAQAAFLNGTAGTMLELDEGNQYSRGHPGIHVIPAVLAASSAQGASGAQALLSIVIGYELGCRIGGATKLRMSVHPHGTWGTPAAALARAKLDGADAAALAGAINVGASLSVATSRRTMLEGATVRNAYAGASNQFGLLAWDLYRAGFSGEVDGVATGFATILGEDFSAEAMLADLGSRWEIARNYFKVHASCRYTHGALDALQAIQTQANAPIRPRDVEAIEVETYSYAAQLDNRAPATTLAGKFSLPFSLATMVAHGAASVPAFQARAITDPDILALAQRVRLHEDPALSAGFPHKRPARVSVVMRDGARFQAECVANKGDIENPLSEAELLSKFTGLAEAVWDGPAVRRIVDLVMAVDTAADLTALNGAIATKPRS
jgi:2-methylcitrate dehydratase PrpD